MPVTTLKSSILKFHQEFALYPLWLCPMRLLSPPSAPTMVDGKPANADAPGVPRLPRGNVNAEPEYELACPIPGGMCSPTPSEQLYVDIGAYGMQRTVRM